MQSTPTLKDTDPHDVFAIESLLHAHAEKVPHTEKAPTLTNETAAPSGAPQVHVAPPVSAGAPIPQVEPTFGAPDARDIKIDRDIPVEDIRPGEIKVDALKALDEGPTAKWVKRVFMALLALVGALAAAAWQHYGDDAKAVAAEWTPPFVLAALPSANKPAVAEQPGAPATEAAVTDQPAAQPAATTAAAAPAQAEPAATAAAPAPIPSAETTQLQSMAQDLAAMSQQVEELKTTVAQLRASQAQMAREMAKAAEARAASEARAANAAPAEQNLRPRVSALTPPPRQAAPPPVRKPKPAAYSSPSYPTAPTAPLPPAQTAVPPPPAPVQQTLADDGAPVVRPPMPVR